MNDELISVIVPIYNSEKYLNKLIISLLKQTYKNFELVLINDGSSDRSESIIKSFNDERIQYYKQENKGSAYSRNRGIELARGKYICFIDHDDYVEEDYLELLINSLKLKNSDLAICEYRIIDNNHGERIKHVNKNDSYENVLIKALSKEFSYYALLNKLFIKSIIIDNNIKFGEGKFYGGDMDFALHYISCINSVSLVEKPLYNYCHHLGSESYRRELSKDFKNEWLYEENTIKLIETYIDDKYRKYISIMYTSYCLHALELLIHFNIKDERYIHCLQLLRKNLIKSVVLDNTKIKSKFKLILVAIKPSIIIKSDRMKGKDEQTKK